MSTTSTVPIRRSLVSFHASCMEFGPTVTMIFSFLDVTWTDKIHRQTMIKKEIEWYPTLPLHLFMQQLWEATNDAELCSIALRMVEYFGRTTPQDGTGNTNSTPPERQA